MTVAQFSKLKGFFDILHKRLWDEWESIAALTGGPVAVPDPPVKLGESVTMWQLFAGVGYARGLFTPEFSEGLVKLCQASDLQRTIGETARVTDPAIDRLFEILVGHFMANELLAAAKKGAAWDFGLGGGVN